MPNIKEVHRVVKRQWPGTLVGAGFLLCAWPAFAEGELNIYNWEAYTSPELIEKFEKAYDVTVTIDGYGSNEAMLAAVTSGGTAYDIVVPGEYMVAIMIKKGLLAKVGPNRMENFKYVDSRWIDVYWDPGRDYSVPWLWGTMAFAVNTEVYDGDIDTLALVFDPPDELKGRIGLHHHVGDVLNAALRFLDLPKCSGDPNDLKELDDLLQRVRPHVKAIANDGEAQIVSGDVGLAMLWNGASMRARAQVPSLKYAYPKEGFTGWMDNVAVLEDAPNLENAKLFVNFVMAPENAALISNFANYANGIVGSEKFMDADLASAPEIVVPENAPAPDFVPPCDEKVVQMYDKIWTNLIE